MNSFTRTLLHILRFFILLLCFLFALELENPSYHRFTLLSIFFSLLVLSIYLKELTWIHSSKFYAYTFLLDAALVFLMEYQSKFILNYYLHIFYFIIILTSGILLPKAKGTLINFIVFILSIYKYVMLLHYDFSSMNISLMVFNLLSFLLIILIIHYAKYQFEEKEKTNLLYEELKNYALRVKELTITEERTRIAMEIHDAIGHSMTGLIMELEMCKRIYNKDPKKVEELMIHATETARKGLVDVRRAVEALKHDENSHHQSPIQAYEEMIRQFHVQSGIKVYLYLSPEKMSVPASIAAVIYRIIQEALTNAGRHSCCSSIHITIKILHDKIILDMQDDGICSSNYTEGNGLKGMRKRMEEVGGRINFTCSNGFKISGEIPILSPGRTALAKNTIK